MEREATRIKVECPAYGRECEPDSRECHGCREESDCYALTKLLQMGFRKLEQPIREMDWLIPLFNDAEDKAWEKFPSENDIVEDNKRKKFIRSSLNKAKESRARELEASARQSRREADLRDAEAMAIRGSGPKSERYPFGWQQNLAKGYRGADILVKLTCLVKEIAWKPESDRLIEELVAKGRYERDCFREYYIDKNGQERFWSATLFQMDHHLAMSARGWKKSKTNRLLRRACEVGVFDSLIKLGPRGQMVYCAGVWQGFDRKVSIKWNFKDEEHWHEVFRKFKLT